MKLPIMTAKMAATSEPPSLRSTYPLEMNDDKFKGSKAAPACLSTAHCCFISFFFPDYKPDVQLDHSVSRLKSKSQFAFAFCLWALEDPAPISIYIAMSTFVC